MGFLPADRKEEGLALKLSVQDNIILSSLKALFPYGYVFSRLAGNTARKFAEDLLIKIPSIYTRTNNLSSGNQQKVVVARWLCRQSKIIIFNEPTRGIDVHAKIEIYKLINKLVQQGVAVIIVSSEFSEIVNLCDKVYVFRQGKVVKEFSHNESSEEKLLAYATGGA